MNKPEINYWLSPAGDCSANIKIMSTEAIQVPKIGEVIDINTTIDFKELEKQYSNLGSGWARLLPAEHINGNFLVVDVKRILKIYISSCNSTEWSDGQGNRCVSTSYIPAALSIESFEVIVEPFRETDLTETPIAKLRNSLSPIFGMVDLLNIIQQFPEKEKEMLELLRGNLDIAKKCIEESRKLLSDNTKWK